MVVLDRRSREKPMDHLTNLHIHMYGVEMACTRLSPLSVLYSGGVTTTPNSIELSHSHCSTLISTLWSTHLPAPRVLAGVEVRSLASRRASPVGGTF
jgi:hypothetical protein